MNEEDHRMMTNLQGICSSSMSTIYLFCLCSLQLPSVGIYVICNLIRSAITHTEVLNIESMTSFKSTNYSFLHFLLLFPLVNSHSIPFHAALSHYDLHLFGYSRSHLSASVASVFPGRFYHPPSFHLACPLQPVVLPTDKHYSRGPHSPGTHPLPPVHQMCSIYPLLRNSRPAYLMAVTPIH